MDLKESIEKLKDSIQDLVSVGPKNIIGIDIGLSAVKVAEMTVNEKDKKYKLLRYASVRLPEAAIIEDEIQKEEEIVNAIDDAISKSGSPAKLATIGLSGPNTIARRLQVAGGSAEEIEDQVMWEAEQYLPFDIDMSTVCHHQIGENEGGGADVLIAAARNDVAESFKSLVEKANVKVKVADLNLLAITNIFEIVMSDRLEEGGESWLVLDFRGAKN